jgi:hypothetical protein
MISVNLLTVNPSLLPDSRRIATGAYDGLGESFGDKKLGCTFDRY